MKSRSIFGPGDLASQEMDTKNRIVGGASSDFDTLGEVEKKFRELENNGYDDTEIKKDIEQIETDILLLKENAEFTPRFIGQYNIPWFIEGQGSISGRLTQIQKNVFLLCFDGGGVPFTIANNPASVDVDLPIKAYTPNDDSFDLLWSPVILSDTLGIAGFHKNKLYFQGAGSVDVGVVSRGSVTIYGELIEEETTE